MLSACGYLWLVLGGCEYFGLVWDGYIWLVWDGYTWFWVVIDGFDWFWLVWVFVASVGWFWQVLLIYIPVLSFSGCLVCVCVCVCVCVLFIYIISISIICVSQEEPSLISCNIWLLQVNNFWKEKMLWKVKFWYQWIIHSVW